MSKSPSMKLTGCAAALLVLAGCSTTSEKVQPPINVASLESMRESGNSVAGPWTNMEDATTNLVAADAPIEDGQERDGTGVSTALLKGFKARDVELEAEVAFDGDGAPALVFRAVEKDNIITSMYAVALYRGGVNVWRMHGGQWYRIESRIAEMKPRSPHLLRVSAKRDTILVFADGQAVTELRDEGFAQEGRAGIRATEGPCKFSGIRIRKQ